MVSDTPNTAEGGSKASRSLLLHLSVAVILVTTLVLLAFGSHRYLSYYQKQRARLDQVLMQTVNRLQVSVSGPLYNIDWAAVQGVLRSELQQHEVMGIFVTETVSSGISFGVAKSAQGAVVIADTCLVDEELLSVSVPLTYEDETLGRVEVFVSTRTMEEDLESMLAREVAITVFLDLILATLVIVILKRRFIEPVVRLTGVAREIADGNLAEAVDVSGQAEIAILADSLNRMRNSIREKIEDLAGKNALLQQEVTERQQAEKALRRSREDLRITLDSIGDGVIATDSEGRVTRMNPVAQELTGW
ncbi:MAG: HAMP domain-containing protein, partial [Planctomycetota bacterium]